MIAPSHYNPDTGEVWLSDNATMYEVFHEHAHQKQHRSCARVWSAWFFGRFFPVINYFVTLWLEYDALRRAHKEMLRAERIFKCRLWDDEVAKEARRRFRSYLLRRELA